MQPSYIPWRGYFHLIQKTDVFVFFDDVQFDRRGWRNRNRIKTAAGPKWLTIPVLSKDNRARETPILEIPICWDREWNANHWETLQHAYRKAPFFDLYAASLREVYAQRPRMLAEFVIDLTMLLALHMGLDGKRFIRASKLGASGKKTDRLINILQTVGANHYISGPSAKEYIEPEKFSAAGIGLEYIRYEYPAYEQLHPPYDPQVSILDLLFMKGPAAPSFIWGLPG